MQCISKFVFKQIQKKPGGEFTNDKGELIKYKGMYLVKVDEIENDLVSERIFKFAEDNIELSNKFKQFKIYDKIEIMFDIKFLVSSVRVVPIDVVEDSDLLENS